jgi:hypothetical protein
MTYLWKTLWEFPIDSLISLRLINILTAPAAVLIYARNNLSTDKQCGIKPIVCEIVRAVKWRVFLLGLLLTTLLINYLNNYRFTGKELVYCDPPYFRETRKKGERLYKYEYSCEQHIELLEVLKTLSCMVASGLRINLVQRIFKGLAYA